MTRLSPWWHKMKKDLYDFLTFSIFDAPELLDDTNVILGAQKKVSKRRQLPVALITMACSFPQQSQDWFYRLILCLSDFLI